MEESPDYNIMRKNKENANEVQRNNPKELSIRRHWNRKYIEKANILLKFLNPILANTKDEIIENGIALSYEFYNKNHRYCA